MYKNHDEIKLFGIVLGHKNVNFDEKIIAASLVNCLIVGETSKNSIISTSKEIFRKYSQLQKES